jgi:hypothetical protein
MNSPLEIRKVRLRGLGGLAACGGLWHLRVRNREVAGSWRSTVSS